MQGFATKMPAIESVSPEERLTMRSSAKSKMKANPDFARNLIAALANAQKVEGKDLFKILSGNEAHAGANSNAGGSAN